MAVAETETNLWEVLAGRDPRRPVAPDAPDVWAQVEARLNPAKARPRLRDGIEEVEHTSVRGAAYVMVRSPDREASYLRLDPDDLALAHLMDGSRTVAQLVGEFSRLSGRLAPDRVTRLVADLAGARLLDELPVDAFAPLEKARRGPLPARIGRGVLAAAQGRRMVVARPDRLMGWIYKGGLRLLFTRAGAVVLTLLSIIGIGLFVQMWTGGAQQVFLVGDSYALGALVILGLNAFCLLCHELGHAVAVKHAGRRCGAIGFLFYFGIPSAFVDTTDVWMADRRKRLITSLAGPAANLSLAGGMQVIALVEPSLAPLAFKLSFAWYLNALFNLNPLMALDGYYLFMDWIEIANLRARGIAFLISVGRTRRVHWARLDREQRYVAMYGAASVLWLIVMANLGVRMYKDRVSGLVAGLWYSGWAGRLLLVALVAALLAPLVYAVVRFVGRRIDRLRERGRERDRVADQPRRLAALAASELAHLPAEVLSRLADAARWVHPRRAGNVIEQGASFPGAVVVVDGALEARRSGDTPGSVRGRAVPGDVVGLTGTLAGSTSPWAWRAAGTRLLVVDRGTVVDAVGPLVHAAGAEAGEAAAVLAGCPALDGLTDDQREALAAHLQHVDIPAGGTFQLSDPNAAAIVASGLVVGGDREWRAGDLIGPPTREPIGGEARSGARLWRLPVGGTLPLLLGTEPLGTDWREDLHREAPRSGVHGRDDYPPLQGPPGPPPPGDDEEDDRLRRRFLLILLALLGLALLTTGMNLPVGLAWAETPDDSALLEVDRGTVEAHVDGDLHRLGAGDRIVLREGDRVAVGVEAGAHLFFRGGGTAELCPAAEAEMGRLRTTGTEQLQPRAALALSASALVADTAPSTTSFEPVELEVAMDDEVVDSADEVEFALGARGGLAVVEGLPGEVRRDGSPVPGTVEAVGCDTVPESRGARPAARPDEGPRRAPDVSTTSEPPATGPSTTAPPTTGGPAPTTSGGGPTPTAGPTPTTGSTGGSTPAPTAPPPTSPPATLPPDSKTTTTTRPRPTSTTTTTICRFRC